MTSPISLFTGIIPSILGQATSRPKGPTIVAAPRINPNLLQTKSYAKTIATSAPTGGSGGGGSYSSNISSSPPINQQAINQYDQAIANTQAAIDRLGTQQKSANTAITSSYQNALNQLLGSKNQANKAYTTNKQQTATDYIGAKNTIGSNAGSTLRGLLRLLGAHGAGGGSAYLIDAPQEVARAATIQRTGASNTFGANQQALDTNWNNYLTDYNNQVSSAKNQRDIQEQQLADKIGNNKATLLQTLADLEGRRAATAGGSSTDAAQPYLDKANAILDNLSNFTVKPIDYTTKAYTAPDLAKYTVNPNAAPTYQGSAAANDYFSPYLSALLGDKRKLAGA